MFLVVLAYLSKYAIKVQKIMHICKQNDLHMSIIFRHKRIWEVFQCPRHQRAFFLLLYSTIIFHLYGKVLTVSRLPWKFLLPTRIIFPIIQTKASSCPYRNNTDRGSFGIIRIEVVVLRFSNHNQQKGWTAIECRKERPYSIRNNLLGNFPKNLRVLDLLFYTASQ